MSTKLQHMQESSEFKGLKIARGVRDVNHSQFANDTILLGGASTIIAERFNGALYIFLKASDEKVNSAKSKIYGWNFPPCTLERIGRTFGFQGNAAWNSFNYLKIPIFKGKKKVVHWQGLVDKIKNKISSWGTRWLNPARNLVLINSILAHYPIYACSISLAPKKTMKVVTKELRRFLCQGGKSSDQKIFHLVNWSTVCTPKNCGGGGIRDPIKMNLDLGAKIL